MQIAAVITDTLICDFCGELCIDGFERRNYGEPDRETGYQDTYIVCAGCLTEAIEEEPDDAPTDDERAWEMAYDCADDKGQMERDGE